ncbi:MAG: hypothetical protein VW879_17030, partial [Opitutae bacterium]
VNSDFVPASQLEDFLSSVETLKSANSNDNDIPEDLPSALNTAFKKLSWSNSSVKHLVVLTDAPSKFNDYEDIAPSDSDMERGDYLGYGDSYSNNTGMSLKQLEAIANPASGSDFQKALKRVGIHAINGRTKPLYDEIREELGDQEDAKEGLDKIKGDRELAERVIKAEIISNKLVLSPLIMRIYVEEKAESQKELQLNALVDDGYYATFNAWTDDRQQVVDGISSALANELKASYDALKVAREGDLADPKKSKFNQSFYEVVIKSGDLQKSIEENAYVDGYAKSINESGREVAQEKFMVFRDELNNLEGSFKSLYDTFNASAQKSDRKNTKQILDQLKAALATTATGDNIDENTWVDEVIINSIR